MDKEEIAGTILMLIGLIGCMGTLGYYIFINSIVGGIIYISVICLIIGIIILCNEY